MNAAAYAYPDHRTGITWPEQAQGGEHFRPDGTLCAYLAHVWCEKCNGDAPVVPAVVKAREAHDRACLCCYCCGHCERPHPAPCPRGCNAGHLLPSALLPAAIPRWPSASPKSPAGARPAPA